MKDRNQRNKQKKVTWRKQTLQEKKIFFKKRNAAFYILREIRKGSPHKTRTGYYFKRGRGLSKEKNL